MRSPLTRMRGGLYWPAQVTRRVRLWSDGSRHVKGEIGYKPWKAQYVGEDIGSGAFPVVLLRVQGYLTASAPNRDRGH